MTKSFLIDDICTDNAKTIAPSFYTFFTNIAYHNKVKTKRLCGTVLCWWKKNLQHFLLPKCYRQWNPWTLYTSVPEKSQWCWQPTPRLLKRHDILTKPLCHLISLWTWTVPYEFKIGKLSAVFKQGTKQLMSNYRPISILPVCSKIFQKCVHNQLKSFIEEHRLLSKHQFGFRKQRNTVPATTHFVDLLRENMNAGKMTGDIFVDLSTAFDILSHSQIVTNCSRCSTTGMER